jgi:hypothetical protein
LAFKLRWGGVICKPRGRIHDVLDAYQAQSACRPGLAVPSCHDLRGTWREE